MLNLFEVAHTIRQHNLFLQGLMEINRSTVFPILPVNLQQQTEKLIHEHTQMISALETTWGSDQKALKEFIEFLKGSPCALDHSHPTFGFIQKTSLMIKQHKYQAKRTVSEVRHALSLVPEDTEDILDLGSID